MPIREDQVKNSAGGFVFQVSPITRLRRFLILGTEKGSYYANETKLTAENATTVIDLITNQKKGLEVLKEVVEISDQGRAAKQDTTIFVLALCLRLGDDEIRKAAYEAIPKVCRIPTHLFQLLTFTTTLTNMNNSKLMPLNGENEQSTDLNFEATSTAETSSHDASPSTKTTVGTKSRRASPPNNGRGFGRAMRRALANWYNAQPPTKLAFTVTKYKSRHGWTHSDILRLAHVKPATVGHHFVYRFVGYGLESALAEVEALELKAMDVEVVEPLAKKERKEDGMEVDEEDWMTVDAESDIKPAQVKALAPAVESPEAPKATADSTPNKRQREPKVYTNTTQLPSDPSVTKTTIQFLKDLETLSQLPPTSIVEAIELIKTHKLAHEHIPNSFLNTPEIWSTLLPSMGLTALIRNLAKMTSLDLFQPLSDSLHHVTTTLSDASKLSKARIHPFNVLVALNQYKQGRGNKGSLQWTPVSQIQDALNTAFYTSFKSVTPTNKRYLIALDVSGSMCAPVLGSNISCRTASAAMAMTLLRTEPKCHVVSFQDTIKPLNLRATDTLEEVERKMDCLPFGGTDCALPMVYAMERSLPVDVFVVFTDSETWFGKVHPCEALKKYRKQMKIEDAKLIVVGMASNGFSIADPEDAGMLDMVGFDSNAPAVMSEFAMGRI
ncbi:60 kDa SS-A/Ro ribonucleoprotein [Chytridiales sp. JEL 0842]|nr:60 kDa SS-A/Ro ribonucleoprotein [Chytridiales sp. JEL 0842]